MTEPLPIEVTLAAEIVAAFVSHNAVPPSGLPDLIASTHAAIVALNPPPVPIVEAPKPVPACPIKASVHDDHLVCLDDGRKLKSLKRHLATLGMTPDQYRAKWGLPKNYPMVSPAYAKARSALAKSLGLGRPKQAADGRVASIRAVA